MPLEGRDFRLELGYGVKMVIEGVEVDVVDVKVISGSRVVVKREEVGIFFVSISEGSDLVAIVGPGRLVKCRQKYHQLTSGLRTFRVQVILVPDLLLVRFLGRARLPPLQFSSVSS